MTNLPAPTDAPPAVAPPASAPNTLGLVAIILAGVGFLLAVIPPTSGIAWLLLIPATVLAIIGLIRKGQKKGTSLAAVIIAPVGWLLSIIVFTASVVAGAGSAFQEGLEEGSNATSQNQSQEEPAAEPEAPGIGDTLTSGDGVSFTVSAVTCGIATVGEDFLAETAKGEFCEVKFTLANGTDDSLNVSGLDVAAAIGSAEYETESSANKFGDDYYSTDINPGLSADCVVYFDVPVGSTLDTVTYSGLFSFDDALTVTVS